MVNPRRMKGGETAFELAQAVRTSRSVFIEAWRGTTITLPRYAPPPEDFPTDVVPTATDMRSIYSTTRILLVPSDCEGDLGRVASEAHVSGIPVLARAIGALPERSGPAGF